MSSPWNAPLEPSYSEEWGDSYTEEVDSLADDELSVNGDDPVIIEDPIDEVENMEDEESFDFDYSLIDGFYEDDIDEDDGEYDDY